MNHAQTTRLYRDVEFLTTLRPFRNHKNLESLRLTREYIENELKAAGYKTELQTWNTGKHDYHNVIAKFKPEKELRLVIGAHYDVCGDTPGADDNASAIAGLLETARIFSELNPDLDYGVDFVAYCLEEPPYFASQHMGSYIHAKSLHDAKTPVIGMICYEMIGFFSEEPDSQQYPHPEMAARYPATGNFIIVVGIEEHRAFNEAIFHGMKQANRIPTEVIHFPGPGGLASMSDHMNYWDFGIPALMINNSSFLRNPHYHRPTDTIETLHFDKMAGVIDAHVSSLLKLRG